KRLNTELYLNNSIIRQPDYDYEMTKEDWEEREEIMKAAKTKEFWAQKPDTTPVHEEHPIMPTQPYQTTEKEQQEMGEMGALMDASDKKFWKEHPPMPEDYGIREQERKPQAVAQQPLLSLYDLFGFSEEERSQITPKKKSKRSVKQAAPVRQLDLFAQPAQNSVSHPIAHTPVEKPVALPIVPRPYEGALADYLKAGSLV
ncbi:putative type I restriction enzymeP M protein, partial [termite gut metagenome]